MDFGSGELIPDSNVGKTDYLWATEDPDVARSHSDDIILEIEAYVADDGFSPTEDEKQGYRTDSYSADDIMAIHCVRGEPDFGSGIGEPDIVVDSKWKLVNLPEKLED
jgi:hypothetical protein